MPILPLLLSASLWQASIDVGKTLSCYEESKNTVVCYDSAGQNPLRIYYSPKKSYSDALVLDLVLNSLGTAADLGTTDWATQHGCTEANPLLPRPESRVAGKIALSVLRGGVAYLLRSHGKKTMADIWRWAGVGTDLLISTNNIVCGSKEK